MARKKIDWSLFGQLMEIDALAEQHTREIFGNRTSLPLDESEIAFNFDLTHEQKMAKLTAIRRGKATKRAARRLARMAPPLPPQSFESRITGGDEFHAGGMGISLA